jgi:hypothetical protein
LDTDSGDADWTLKAADSAFAITHHTNLGIGGDVSSKILECTSTGIGIRATPNSSYALDVVGDTRVTGSLEATTNLVVGGNLTVSGTTTTVNSETINLADNIIQLNSNFTGDPVNEDAGIEINRGNYTNVQLYWDESERSWIVQEAPDSGGAASAYALLHTGNTVDQTFTLDGGTY